MGEAKRRLNTGGMLSRGVRRLAALEARLAEKIDAGEDTCWVREEIEEAVSKVEAYLRKGNHGESAGAGEISDAQARARRAVAVGRASRFRRGAGRNL
jgi:hypothetical protein